MPLRNTDPCAAYATDELLLNALQRRVREAIECFYKRNYRKVLSSLSWKKGQKQDLEDAFQDGMIAFLEHSNRVEIRAKLDTLLYQIVHNRWIDMLRKKRPNENLDELVSQPVSVTPDPLAHLLDADMQHQLRQAIAELTPASQKLMDLLLYQHYTPEEAAQELGIAIDSVYNQKTRCLKVLRQRLSHLKP